MKGSESTLDDGEGKFGEAALEGRSEWVWGGMSVLKNGFKHPPPEEINIGSQITW